MSTPTLEFTGERFTPECVREIWYEHMHRYALAAGLACGRQVLDAACGEGYGSAMLAAAGAASVQGLDIDPAAINHARTRYAGQAVLRFDVADVTALESFPEASFDLICSFETLEHVQAQERMLDGFLRLLRPDGILLVSTPDKHVYSELTGFHNAFHVRELYRDEFTGMLAGRFPAVRMLGQKLLFQSVIWEAGRPGPWAASTHGAAAAGLAYAPVYWIAACARRADLLETLPSLHLFGDADESVYQHYFQEIRQSIEAGTRVKELLREVEALKAQLAQLSPSQEQP